MVDAVLEVEDFFETGLFSLRSTVYAVVACVQLGLQVSTVMLSAFLAKNCLRVDQLRFFLISLDYHERSSCNAYTGEKGAKTSNHFSDHCLLESNSVFEGRIEKCGLQKESSIHEKRPLQCCRPNVLIVSVRLRDLFRQSLGGAARSSNRYTLLPLSSYEKRFSFYCHIQNF